MIEQDLSPAQAVLAPQVFSDAISKLPPLVSAASPRFWQPACGNPEGWGPVSKTRFDFTPCFLDVWISATSLFGIICGGLAIWYILYSTIPQPVKKNWHFWTKLVSFLRMLHP